MIERWPTMWELRVSCLLTIESSVQSLSPSRHDCQYLQTLNFCEVCYKELLPEIVIDLIGEEFDNLVDIDDEKEEELEDINVSLKRINNIWNCTIDWANVNLSFLRLGEGERQLRRKRKFTREIEKSMPKNALHKYLVPLEVDGDGEEEDEDEDNIVEEDLVSTPTERDATEDIEQIMKDTLVDKDDWASVQNMESAITNLEGSTAKIHKNSDIEQKQIKETTRFEYLQAICIVRYLQKRLQ